MGMVAWKAYDGDNVQIDLDLLDTSFHCRYTFLVSNGSKCIANAQK